MSDAIGSPAKYATVSRVGLASSVSPGSRRAAAGVQPPAVTTTRSPGTSSSDSTRVRSRISAPAARAPSANAATAASASEMPASLVKISESASSYAKPKRSRACAGVSSSNGTPAAARAPGAQLRVGLDVDEPAELEQRPPRLALELAPELVRPLREPDPVLLGVREPEDARRAVARAARVPELELLVDRHLVAALGDRARAGEPHHAGADDRDLHAASARIASEIRGHASSAHLSNSRSVRQAQARCASRSIQRNVPLPPKWPNVPRRIARPGPVRLLRVAELDAEAPVVRLEAADVRQDARRGPGTGPTSSRRASPARRASARRARARTRSGRRACRGSLPRPTRAARRSSRAARSPRRGGSRRTASRPRARRVAASTSKPGVRVDPPPARLRDRLRAVERQARRVREQVADRRALGPGGVVEVDRRPPPRRPAPRARRAASRSTPSARRRRAGRASREPRRRAARRPRRPPLPSRRSAAAPPRGAILRGAWSGGSSPRARPGRSGTATRARSSPARTCTSAGTAPQMPDDADPPAGAVRAGAALPRDRRRTRWRTRARRLPTSCARAIFVSRPGAHRRRSCARTARRSATRVPPARPSSSDLLDPRWLVEIEADAILPS